MDSIDGRFCPFLPIFNDFQKSLFLVRSVNFSYLCEIKPQDKLFIFGRSRFFTDWLVCGRRIAIALTVKITCATVVIITAIDAPKACWFVTFGAVGLLIKLTFAAFIRT
jgi:hypothetical protein